MSTSKDLFSSQAGGYATFRPTYPPALYEFILSHVKEKKTAWDCGCGSGQVARDLSPYFETVRATDISAKQLSHAIAKPSIIYSLSAAEATAFPDHAFDLITVGQAIHWFKLPEFFKEVKRVAKPGGILAAWGYSLLSINNKIDPLIADFYKNVIGPYWDAERKLIDDQYKTIDFPFPKIPSPEFDFSFQWTIDDLAGYLSTWSSVQKFIRQHDHNPVEDLIKRIRPHWHDERCGVRFPLFILVGDLGKV